MEIEKEQRLQEIYNRMTHNMIRAKEGGWENKTLGNHLEYAISTLALTKDYCCELWGINPENVFLDLNLGSFCRPITDKETGEKYFSINLDIGDALLTRPERIQRVCFHEFRHAYQLNRGNIANYYHRIGPNHKTLHSIAWKGTPAETDADKYSQKQLIGILKQANTQAPRVVKPENIQEYKDFALKSNLQHLYCTPLAPLIGLGFEVEHIVQKTANFVNQINNKISETISKGIDKVTRIFNPNKEPITPQEKTPTEINVQSEHHSHPIGLNEMMFLVQRNPQIFNKIVPNTENLTSKENLKNAINSEEYKEALELFKSSNNQSIREQMHIENLARQTAEQLANQNFKQDNGIRVSKEQTEKIEQNPEEQNETNISQGLLGGAREQANQSGISQGLLTTSREQAVREIEETLSAWEREAGIAPPPTEDENTSQTTANGISQGLLTNAREQSSNQPQYSQTSIDIANQILNSRQISEPEQNVIEEISATATAQTAETDSQINTNSAEAVIDDGMDLTQ